MSDFISADERSLIDAHLMDVGATNCVPNTFTDDVISFHGGGEKAKDARRRAARRQRRFTHVNDKDRAPSPTDRTVRIIEMAKTMTAREIATATGLKRNSVSKLLGSHGFKAVAQNVRDQEARDARRAPIRVMMAEGLSAAEISGKTGQSVGIVTADIKALVSEGAVRKAPKDGPKINQSALARRVRVRGMMGEGRSLNEMVAATGVSKTTIRWDIQMLEREGAVRVYAKAGRRARKTIGDEEPAKVALA